MDLQNLISQLLGGGGSQQGMDRNMVWAMLAALGMREAVDLFGKATKVTGVPPQGQGEMPPMGRMAQAGPQGMPQGTGMPSGTGPVMG